MSGTVAEGPLDVTRRLNEEAMGLSSMHELCFPQDSPEHREIRQMLNVLEAEHPLMGQQVNMYGTPLVPGVGEGVDLPLMIAKREEGRPGSGEYTGWHRPITGQYQGMYILEVFAPDEPVKVQVIAHGVLTDVIDERRPNGDFVVTHQMSYVLADDECVIRPIVPVRAHSLKDLSADPVTAQFDELIHDLIEDRVKLFRSLGDLANRLFEDANHLEDKNVQRVSYLNASRLLDGLLIHSNDFVTGNRAAYLRDQYQGATYSKPYIDEVALSYGVFDILPGYQRPTKRAIKFDTPTELFISGLMDGRWVAMPARSVTDVREEQAS